MKSFIINQLMKIVWQPVMSPVAVERPQKLVSEPLQPLPAPDTSKENTEKGGASEENIAHPPSLMPHPIPGVEASSSTSPRPSVAIAQAKQAQDSPRLPKRAPQLALKALATPPTEEPPEHARFTPAGEEGTPSKGIRGNYVCTKQIVANLMHAGCP